MRSATTLALGVSLALLAGSAIAAPGSGATRGEYRLAWPAGVLASGGSGLDAWHQLRTDPAAGPSLAVSAEPLRPALDLRRRFVRLRVKVDDVARLRGLELRLGSRGFDHHFAFALPLYADPEANRVRDGAWANLSFAFAAARTVGTPDRAAIDRLGIHVTDTGEPVRVSWTDLEVVPQAATGVVSLSFDDGYAEHLDAARWMAEYGFRGTAYVIPESLGQPSYLTLDQTRELSALGWEIAAHHETPFTEIELGELDATVGAVQRFLRENGFAEDASHLAYPLGKQNDPGVRALVRDRFTTARMAGGGFETLPPADPHLLRVMNVLNTTTPREIGAAAREAGAEGAWLILMFQFLPERADSPTAYAAADFRKALREIAASRVLVRPVGETWKRCCDASEWRQAR